MYTFMVDETNKDFVTNHFFIVGGLVITEEQVDLVDTAVRQRRAKAGFRAGDSFKFDTNSRKEHVDFAAHREAKKGLLEDLSEIGVRMLVSVVLHDLAAQNDHNTRMDWALNTLTGAYRRLLAEERATGIMLIDRDNDRFNHLEYLFQHGMKMYKGGHIVANDRIRLFGMTNDNASHLSSAADIALGAFRFCANSAVGAGNETVARAMFPSLAKIMWKKTDAAGNDVFNGFGYYPRPPLHKVGDAGMRDRYNKLAIALTNYSLEPVPAT